MSNRGQALDKALEERDDRGDGGLLKHDLGDPNAIRIFVRAPREVASILPVPIDKDLSQNRGAVRLLFHRFIL